MSSLFKNPLIGNDSELEGSKPVKLDVKDCGLVVVSLLIEEMELIFGFDVVTRADDDDDFDDEDEESDGEEDAENSLKKSII